MYSKYRPIGSLHSSNTFGFDSHQNTLPFLQRYRHFLDCSASDGKSLQLHVHALIQNFDCCNLMSDCFIINFRNSKDPLCSSCIKINFKEIEHMGVKWIHLARDKINRLAFMNMIMYHRGL
jgi:hypothetical protein